MLDERDHRSSLLTDWHRTIVRENPDPNATVRKAREEMRKRARVGINHDFPLLNQYIRDDDIEQIFGEDLRYIPPTPHNEGMEPSDLNHEYVGVFHALQFFYRGLRARGMTDREFGDLVRKSVKFAEAKYRDVPVKQINVSGDLSEEGLTVKYHEDYDGLSPYEKLERGLTLADEDWATLRNDLLDRYNREELLGEDLLDLVDE